MAHGPDILTIDQVPLIFGLEWIPLLGDVAGARALARRHGVSHCVLSGDPPGALGLVRALRARRAWSAADLFARQYPTGTVAAILHREDRGWHVLACHEGVVLARADRLYATEVLARHAVDGLRLSHPRLEIIDTTCGTGTRDDHKGALLPALARRAATTAPLGRVYRVSLRVALGVLAVIGVLLAWLAQGYFPPTPVATSGHQARVAWTQALAAVLGSRPIQGPEGSRALLRALHGQPARLAGWSLQSLHCEPGTVPDHWQCVSEYRRNHPQADNRGFLRQAPDGWRTDFPSLDRARVAWTLDVPGQVANPETLPAAPILARDWASALQAVLPAFSVLRLSAPRPLSIPVPKNGDDAEMAVPEDFPLLATRTLHVQGPLRSAVLLVPLAQAVSWQKAVLSVVPDVRPGVRTSRLTLHLEGIVYERLS